MGYDEAGPAGDDQFRRISAGRPRPRCRTIDILHHESPTPLNPLGVKGVGECGVLPTPAAIVAAIEDALSPFGVRIAQAPIRPHEIVALVNRSRSSR